MTNTAGSDETGIVVAGLACDRQIYVLADISLKGSTDTLAKRAVDAYHLHEADRIVAEVNNGGDLVERVINAADKSVPYKAVRVAGQAGARRARQHAVNEQDRVHHVSVFAALEDQQCTFVPLSARAAPIAPTRSSGLSLS